MQEYFAPIRTALQIFPAVAAAGAAPIMVSHYRRFGRLQPVRTGMLYSMIFYGIAALFLVILPLPERTADFAARYAGAKTPQLTPFTFIADFAAAAAERDPSSLRDVLALAGMRRFLQPFFNLLLLLPLGFYLRYYFRLHLVKSAAVLVVTTLGFELLQFTGLLGLYPVPYRLFDVDDLMLNTAGGVLGYAAAPLLARVLPSPKPSYAARPAFVALGRRALAFGADLLLIFATVVAAMLIPPLPRAVQPWVGVGAIIIDLLLLPMLPRRQTLGMMLLRFRIVGAGARCATIPQILARFVMLVGVPYGFARIVIESGVIRRSLGFVGSLIEAVLFLGLLGAYLGTAVLRRDHRGVHELAARTDVEAVTISSPSSRRQ